MRSEQKMESALKETGVFCLADIEMTDALNEKILRACREGGTSAKTEANGGKHERFWKKTLPIAGLGTAAVVLLSFFLLREKSWESMKSANYSLEGQQEAAREDQAVLEKSDPKRSNEERVAGAVPFSAAEEKAPAKDTASEEDGAEAKLSANLDGFSPPGFEQAVGKLQQHASTYKYSFSVGAKKLTIFADSDEKTGKALLLSGQTDMLDLNGTALSMKKMDGGLVLSWQSKGLFLALTLSSKEEDVEEQAIEIVEALQFYLEHRN